MKNYIFLFVCLAGLSCQNEKEPVMYDGTANLFVTDGEIADTIRSCYCWKTTDSIAVLIHRGPYSGISINISGKNGEHSVVTEYYSDTNEFDGQFEMQVPTEQDSLSITYQTLKDSIRISGYINLISKEVKLYNDGRKVKAEGSFSCTMKK